MIIEQAKIEDAEEILFLQKLAYVSEAKIYKNFDIQPLRQSLDEIKAEFDNQIFFKGLQEGRIFGSVRGYLKDKTCCIGKLIVHPEMENRGLGTRLMKYIEDFFITAKRFELFTGSKSQRNLYLYRKLGYIIFKSEKINDDFTVVFLEKYRDHTLPA